MSTLVTVICMFIIITNILLSVGDYKINVAIEYGKPGYASTFAAANLNSVKIFIEIAIWANIEWNLGIYDFNVTDALILEYQNSSYNNIELLLSAQHPNASIDYNNNYMPKNEKMFNLYCKYISTIVERYDNDGYNDMPNLKYPILRYAIEKEASGYWPSKNATDYGILLQRAYKSIKSANNTVKVSLIGLLMVDAFNFGPINNNISHATQYMIKYSPNYRFNLQQIKQILNLCDYYDEIDLHSLGDYTELSSSYDWIRYQLSISNNINCRKNAYKIPIFIGDCFPMNPLSLYGEGLPIFPVMKNQTNIVIEWLQSVIDNNLTATNWIRHITAISAIRKITIAAYKGYVGINIGNQEDWTIGTKSIDKSYIWASGASIISGNLDDTLKTGKNKYAGGQELPGDGSYWGIIRIPTPNTQRPIYYALQLFQELIPIGYKYINKCIGKPLEPIINNQYIFCYSFVDKNNHYVIIAWYDIQQLYLPMQLSNTPNISYALYLGNGNINNKNKGIMIITLQTQQGNKTHNTVFVNGTNLNNNTLNINFGYTPKFIIYDII